MLTRRDIPALSRIGEWVDDAARPIGPTAIVVGLVVVYLGALAWSWQHVSYDVWGALLIAPLLVALVVPLGKIAATHEDDPAMFRIVLFAFAAKLMMSLVRYAIAFAVYGQADAGDYHNIGRALSRQFRSGDFTTLGEPLTGSGFMRVLTGAIYTVTGPTKLGGFVIFAFIGFIGQWLFYRAFRMAMPEADHRRYALLVLFLPTMLFWSASIGKDTWMLVNLGIATYGASRMLVHRRGGLTTFVIGIGLAAIVRPHVALMLFLGVSVAYGIRRPTRRTVFGPLPKVIGLATLVLVGSFLLNRVEDQLGVDELQQGGFEQALSNTSRRTDQGGSTFEPVAVTDPIRYGWAVVTVLFRPFPYEAANPQAMLASLEGMAMLGLVLSNVMRGARLLTRLRSWPFGVIALTFTGVFCYAFASVSNFGILTRQRVQVVPFLLVLLCLPSRADEPHELRSL